MKKQTFNNKLTDQLKYCGTSKNVLPINKIYIYNNKYCSSCSDEHLFIQGNSYFYSFLV